MNEFREYYMGQFVSDDKRPYRNLSHKELEAELTRQLPRKARDMTDKKIDATVFGDANKTYLVGTTSNILYNTAYMTSTGTATWSDKTVGQVVAPYVEGTAKEKKPESDMAWLHRRVAEVLWKPA